MKPFNIRSSASRFGFMTISRGLVTISASTLAGAWSVFEQSGFSRQDCVNVFPSK